jgi:hypothetical protein
LLVLGTLSSACGSGEHTRVDPKREDPRLVDFDSTINVCPEFQGSAANPTEIPLEQPAQILVLAYDPDGFDLELEFEWSAESGTFSEPTRAFTEYRCDRPGAQLLRVAARDSDGCESSLSVSVTCLAP